MSEMSRERLKELLPIMQAWAEGKTVQEQRSNGVWIDVVETDWSYGPGRYRIKPEEVKTLPYRRFVFMNGLGERAVGVTQEYNYSGVEVSERFIEWIDEEPQQHIVKKEM